MAGRRSVSRSEGSKKDTQTAKEKKKEKKKEGGIEGAREFLREKVFEIKERMNPFPATCLKEWEACSSSHYNRPCTMVQKNPTGRNWVFSTSNKNLKWEFFVILMVMLDIGCVFSVTILDDIVGEPDKWEFGPDATLLYSTKRAEAYA
eukprot:g17247.t1